LTTSWTRYELRVKQFFSTRANLYCLVMPESRSTRDFQHHTVAPRDLSFKQWRLKQSFEHL